MSFPYQFPTEHYQYPNASFQFPNPWYFNEIMARPMPFVAGPAHSAAESILSTIRQLAEDSTNGDPRVFIDHQAYAQLQQWCQSKEGREVVEDVIKGRLQLPWPYNHKALILAQMLPPASLGALKDLIKPLAEGSSPFTSALAATLHETADKEKQAEEAKNDQYKWDLWGQHVGTSQTAWLPPPVDPQLGMFGLQGVVPAEQWWAAGRK